jgi:hypothetical protein
VATIKDRLVAPWLANAKRKRERRKEYIARRKQKKDKHNKKSLPEGMELEA